MTLLSVDAFVAGAYGILGALFFIVGLAQLISGLASRSWDTVSGEIIESRVRYPRWEILSGFRWLGVTDIRSKDSHMKEIGSALGNYCGSLREVRPSVP